MKGDDIGGVILLCNSLMLKMPLAIRQVEEIIGTGKDSWKEETFASGVTVKKLLSTNVPHPYGSCEVRIDNDQVCHLISLNVRSEINLNIETIEGHISDKPLKRGPITLAVNCPYYYSVYEVPGQGRLAMTYMKESGKVVSVTIKGLQSRLKTAPYYPE